MRVFEWYQCTMKWEVGEDCILDCVSRAVTFNIAYKIPFLFCRIFFGGTIDTHARNDNDNE